MQEIGGNLNPGSFWPLISLRSWTTQAAGTQQERAELCPEAASQRHGSRCLKPTPSVNLCFSVLSTARGKEAPQVTLPLACVGVTLSPRAAGKDTGMVAKAQKEALPPLGALGSGRGWWRWSVHMG